MGDIRSTITRQPVTVDKSTSIQDAAREMERQGVGALLVVEDDDNLVGIVTDRDIVLRGVARGVSPDSQIEALTTTEVITIPAGIDVERAYRVFRDHAFRRLPVMEGRRVVGLLSVDDLLIRNERQVADLVHPLADEVFTPHHEAGPPETRSTAAAAPAPHAATPELPPRRRKMRAAPGDTLVVHRSSTQQSDRTGEIFEVRSPAGDPPFAVRWSDTGHVSFIYPGPDAEVRHRGEPAHSGTR
ncbi:putative signal-transduction protein with CBS domains [Parafrankia sp. EAN1pec]|uniref:CBS domain-containing protein n=1 Tax=Parafrankia sp. (strain EAN1pec) TaxID=298653 RepID=UPI0000542CBD|nr:putative signal-transduction protein with CBS domains [Frankia sp. EAN1pec]